MFRELRNSPMPEEETSELLIKGEYGVLSTSGSDGYAYGVPINYAYLNGCIYIHGAKIGHRMENIIFNPSVSFCVVDSVEVLSEKFDTLFRSVVVFGKAEVVEDKDERHVALVALLEKYSPNYMESGLQYIESAWDMTSVVRIAIEHMTGKAQK